MRHFLENLKILARWLLNRNRARAFERPTYIGRGFEIGPNVQIGCGANIGHDVRIEGDVVIGENVILETGALLIGSITIGSDTCVGRHTYLGTGPQGRITVGSNVHVNSFSSFGAMKSLNIGDHCIFAAYIQVTDSEHGMELNVLVKEAPINSEPVSIGEGVWLGSHVVILKGVKIGAHAVIGAHSLVNDDIPENAIAFGIPAKMHRLRSQQNEKQPL